MKFADFNFKLVVINELLETGSFAEELKFLTAQKRYGEAYSGFSQEYGYDKPIEEIVRFLQNVELTLSDLAAIKSLCFDGGNKIYQIVMPFWDGEDDYFDVKSVNEFENFPNLKEVFNISMINEEELARFRNAGITVK